MKTSRTSSGLLHESRAGSGLYSQNLHNTLLCWVSSTSFTKVYQIVWHPLRSVMPKIVCPPFLRLIQLSPRRQPSPFLALGVLALSPNIFYNDRGSADWHVSVLRAVPYVRSAHWMSTN